MRFFLVDRVDELIPGQSIRGVKAITLSEDYLHDHFPSYPLFPGTLMVEALAQLGGFLVEASCPASPDPSASPPRAVLAQIEKAKFHQPAGPGDLLELRCRLLSTLEGAAQVEGEASIGGGGKTRAKAAMARLTFVLRHVDSELVHQQRRELYRLWTRHLHLDLPLL